MYFDIKIDVQRVTACAVLTHADFGRGSAAADRFFVAENGGIGTGMSSYGSAQASSLVAFAQGIYGEQH